MTLASGTILGPYRVESLLGRGGMGEVYLATQEGLGRRVALKVLAPELAADPGFRQRFIAESRLAASLDHPHIVPIYEAGEIDGRLFLAMRYVEGDDLGAIIARDGPLEPARAIGLLGGIATALDAAHDQGLVHRDVKPGNILVARTSRGNEHAYLGDFGLVKQLGSDAGFTRSGQLVGSVDYVAPEQIEGRPIDHRVDVYSLACVLYTALAGRPPYERESDMATLWAHVQTDPPRLSDLRPDLASFDPVIATGMAKDPAERYASVSELLAAAEVPVAVRRAAATHGVFRPESSAGSRRFIAIGSMGVLLLIGAVAGAASFLRPVTDAPALGPSGQAPSRASAGSVMTIVVPSLNPEAGIVSVGLEPGTHRFEQLSPVATFDTPKGNWWAYRDYIDAAGLYLLDPGVEEFPPSADAYVGWLDFGRVQVVFDGACLDSDTILLDSSPNALIDWLQDHELLESSNALPVNLAGYSGLQVDVTVASLQGDPCETDGPTPRTFLFPFGEDYFSLLPEDRLRVIALDVGARALTILITSPAETFDAFAESARPILQSLRLTP